MKKLLLLVLLFISVVANAQKGISYQAVVLDPASIELPGSDITGQPLVNGNVSVKFVIISGTNIQFEEVHQTKTDAYGLVNLTIGSVASTAFNAMSWDANQKSLQVFVSFDNRASYTKVSDQKLTYSPYALFAETAGKLSTTLGITGGGTGATTAVGARANLGLGNVDNTADADKPISAATQAALNLKANVADVNAALDLKASAAMLAAHMAITVDTSMLATKAALTDLNSYAPINSPTFTGTVSGITKSMVGLGSVDNTADAAKPISTATQAALDLKANGSNVSASLASKAPLNSPSLTGVPTAPTAIAGTNSTQIATTAYTTAAIAAATAGVSSGVADNSVTSVKILNGAVTDAKITSVSGSKITGVIPVASGGTGQTTVSGILSTLGFASNNIAIGSQAGTPNQGGNANTVAIGGGAGNTNQGQSSIAIGYVSGNQNQGANSISIGGNAAQANQAGESVAIGFAAGQNNQGTGAIAIGTFAGQSNQAANSIALNAAGSSSPLNPSNAGFYVNPIRSASATSSLLYYNAGTKEVTTATGGFVDLTTAQTIAGVKTFSSNISANGVSLGRGAGNNDESVAIGQGAMGSSNVNGKRNTALGAFAMTRYNGTAWDNNTSIGYNNLPSMTSGSGNTSVGAESMMSLVTGQENTSIGNQSLISVTGNSNVGVGKRSGQTITSGSQNTILGTDADVSSATLNNATAVGYGAQVAASNTIQLGNSSVTSVKTNGSITAGAVTYPNTDGASGYYLKTDGAGTANWAAVSSSGIPYTGATGGVDLGGYNLTVNGITVGSNGNLDFMSPPYSSTILGKNATISNNRSYAIAIGYNANAAVQATAIGSGATANVTQGMAIGFNTTSTGGYGIAVGPQARASSLYATAFGNLANASANYALSIGTFSTASGVNATAIGYQATNSSDNTIQLGNSSITNVNTSGTLTAGTVTYPNVHGSANQVLSTTGSGTLTWTTPSSGGSGGTHTIGEAYGGGIVFYVYDGGKHGLIAATADQSTGIRWYGGTSTNTRARAVGIGAGLKNTALIIANQAAVDGNNFAATVCNDYSVTETVGGISTTYGDWYLPSTYELDLLYLQKVVVGGFSGVPYWSSTEGDAGGARSLNFADRSGNNNYKSDLKSVRAIRSF